MNARRIPNALDVAEPNDVAWLRSVGGVRVFLDDVLIERVCAFNVSEGWVERYIFSPVPGAGMGVVRDNDGNVLTRKEQGRVEVFLAKGN